MKHHVVIEDWEGDGAIRLPDDVLQEMGVDIGSTLYLLEEYVGKIDGPHFVFCAIDNRH